jgi:hypothetical protein
MGQSRESVRLDRFAAPCAACPYKPFRMNQNKMGRFAGDAFIVLSSIAPTFLGGSPCAGHNVSSLWRKSPVRIVGPRWYRIVFSNSNWHLLFCSVLPVQFTMNYTGGFLTSEKGNGWLDCESIKGARAYLPVFQAKRVSTDEPRKQAIAWVPDGCRMRTMMW